MKIPQVAEKTSKFKVDTESRNKLNTQMVHRKGHHRDKRPSMVSEMGGRMRGSYGNILQNNNNSRTNTFGYNRAISLDHYSNHRRMSDGIQTVTSDSTVYYQQQQRLHDQDNLLLRATTAGKSDVKLLVSSGEEPMNNLKCPIQSTMAVSSAAVNDNVSDTNRVQSSNNSNNNNNNCSNNSNNNSTSSSVVTSKSNLKSKLNSSSVTCSNSPKSIITRLRQLTGRLSFSFDKDASRRINTGSAPQASIIKTSTSPTKNNNMMPNICCNTKSAMGNAAEISTRNRAYSLDVPPIKFNYNSSGASSNNGSHKSLSSATNNRNEELAIADDSTDTNSAVFASKKMSIAEVEAMDL